MESNEQSLRETYKTLFTSEAGKLVLKDLENQGFFNITTATMEPHFMWVNEGRRQMVLYIKEMMEEIVNTIVTNNDVEDEYE